MGRDLADARVAVVGVVLLVVVDVGVDEEDPVVEVLVRGGRGGGLRGVRLEIVAFGEDENVRNDVKMM